MQITEPVEVCAEIRLKTELLRKVLTRSGVDNGQNKNYGQ
jgi:hypothetical protein